MLPLTYEQAIVNGYTPAGADLTRLLRHPAYPGLLFKSVASVEEAILTGGLIMASGTRALMYFGRTLRAAFDHDLFGKILKPTVTITRTTGRKRVAMYNQQLAFRSHMIPVSYGYDQFVPATQGFLAIVSKATDGMVAVGKFNGGSGLTGAVVDFDRSNSAAPEALTGCTILDPNAGRPIIVADDRGVTGFIKLSYDFPASVFTAGVRTAFLAELPEDVKAVYGEEYDIAAKAILTGAKYASAITLHASGDATGRLVWSTKCVIPIDKTSTLFGVKDSSDGLAPNDRTPSYYGAPRNAVPTGQVLPSLAFRCVDYKKNESSSPVRVAPSDVFPADAVPFATVTFSDKQVMNIGTVMASLFPGGRPAGSQSGTLSVPAMWQNELSLVHEMTETPDATIPGGTTPEVQTWVGGARTNDVILTTARELLSDHIQPELRPIARLLETVHKAVKGRAA